MADQVGRLRELSLLDNIDIRVLPWEVGAHAAMLGAFTILDFDDPDGPSGGVPGDAGRCQVPGATGGTGRVPANL
jgi:hypothetical protein